ncbi:TPA: hypothetical protein I8235_000045 [Kluyvera intermedia]|nr:hypothetical protein [Kluyvera intermedia]
MGALEAAAGLTAAGSIIGASNAYQAGKKQKGLYDSQAEVLRKQANNVNAAAQQQAIGETDKSRQAESTALANAAASGGGASDVDVINNMAGLEQQGQLNNMTTLWNGEQQANQLKTQASTLNVQGRMAKQAGKTQALTSILGGGGSIAYMYR